MEASYIDEREDVQKKTFTKWINSQLVKNDKPLVEDLFSELRDGEVLLSLLEILTAQQYKRERGRMRVHHINNVNTALGVLEQSGVRLVNISAGDVVDGNPKLILGLVWSVILHWQVHYHLKELMSELQHTSLEKTLLAWCRTHTQNYSGVNVRNFTTSWSDGLALNALLHRWRPQLFDYAAVLTRAPHQRLEHAFALAHRHLAIPRLLDPEDVNTSQPDKKSIMMYLMCLFQSLPHAGEDVAELDASGGSSPRLSHTPHDTSAGGGSGAGGGGGGGDSASRPLSSATTASGELGGYGAALEDVLAWLLEAEERLGDRAPADPAAPIQQLKEHFHTHERFLLELSELQARVGAVLEQGARLLSDGGLAGDEADEVRLQMQLLNQRWEQLRERAMKRQSSVHVALMHAQRQALQRFRQWLTETEDRMSRMGAARSSGDARSARAALAAVRALHADLVAQQPLVDALADCVVVVDADGDADADAGVTEIEDQLTALGERWTHTYQWTLEQLQRLTSLEERWTQLDERHAALLSDADQLETALKQMEANPVGEVGAVVERIAQLQRLQRHVSRQRRAAASHLDGAAALADGAAPELERAEALHDRLDALTMILEVQAQRIRELGFEFDIETNAEDSPPPEPAVMEPEPESPAVKAEPESPAVKAEPESPAAAAPESEVAAATDAAHSSRKKPRLTPTADEFHAGLTAFDNWLEGSEKALAECGAALERRSGAEARRGASGTVERVARESADRRPDLAHLQHLQRRLNNANTAPHQEEAKQQAASIEKVKQRWEGIQQGLLDIRNTMNLLEDKDNFCAGAAALSGEVEEAREWRERVVGGASAPSHALLVHVRNKLRALRQHRPALERLNAAAALLLDRHISQTHKEHVEAECTRLNDGYQRLVADLAAAELDMKRTLAARRDDDRPPATTAEPQVDIRARVAAIASTSRREPAEEELPAARERLAELRALAAELADLKKDAPADLADTINETDDALQQTIAQLDKEVESVERLERECSSLESVLSTLEAERPSPPPPSPAPSHDHAAQLLLDEAQRYEWEWEQCTAALASVSAALGAVSGARWGAAVGRAERAVGRAGGARARAGRARAAADVLARAHATEHWLRDVEEQLPRDHEYSIADSAELYQMKARFQALKDKCDDYTAEFRSLNEAGNDALLQCEGEPPAVLARALTHLNARWTQVTHGVYERHKVLAEAWHESGELRAWLAQEGAWLDGLQRRLRREPNAPADAEEIADELYDLENYLQNHSAARLARIRDVGRQLADAHIMPAWIRAEVDALERRGDDLRAQAGARTALLERAAREAARSEVSVDNLQQWLDTVLAQTDIAHHHQTLSTELEAQRGVVREVEAQAETYRAAGKLEAAARLREQLTLVQRKFAAAEERLASVGRGEGGGEGLEPRLARAMAALRDVQRGAGDLAPTSAEPDAVRAQLRRCLRLYRTLSEIKSEVEAVIRSGRRAVEERGAGGGGEELSRQVDALKDLYNRLGAAVTDAKGRLEAALLSARELQNDLHCLASWLDGLPAAKRLGPQTLELEMSRMQAARDKLNANYAHFAAHCDAARLAPLRDQVDALNARWDHLRKHGLARPNDAADPAPPPAAALADDTASAPAADSPTEYENVTDTIKRRLESPVNAPDSDRPELKKSKIPLAVRSPAPIRREVKEGGARSRGASLERALPTTPVSPVSPAKDSSTFNLLKDSDLFNQISNDKMEPPMQENEPSGAADPCHVVAVTEREIVKGKVSPAEEEARPSPAPHTFVVEVRTVEACMRPTRGVLRPSADCHVPEEVAALPEPSATAAPEVIYAEVDDAPQLEERSPQPLGTSTPVRGGAAQVVAMSPKAGARLSPLADPHTPEPHRDKYQKTADPAPEQEPSVVSTEPEPAESVLKARFGSECDAELAEFEAAAAAVSRRMDVMLITVGGVSSERDPGKRLEILKHQLGALAPDAAELISRGDSLVYARHRTNPLLADFLQAHLQDRLRAKWARVMAEIEDKRHLAMRAEDHLKELNRLVESLQKWLKEVEGSVKSEGGVPLSEVLSREGEAERVGELCAELRAARVGYPERAVADVTAALRQLRDHKAEGGEVGGELVTRANRVRACVASALGALRAAPLGTTDYDDFPLQEDALARVKSALEEVSGRAEEVEREWGRVSARLGPEHAEQARRVRDKLRRELHALRTAHTQRQLRWSRCQTVWAGLYGALESSGEWLDGAERELAELYAEPPPPLAELRQRLTNLDKQMGARAGEVSGAREGGRAVVGACGATLARDVQDQLDALNERWLALATRLHRLRDRVSAEEGAETALRQVRELLDTTSANPSDHTSLSIRLSLVKAREEELAQRLREMEVVRDVPRLRTELEQAATKLGAHREYIGLRLSALAAAGARLDAAAAWLSEARARAAAAAALSPPHRDTALDALARSAREQEAEVRSVREQFVELERECSEARHSVSGELRERVQRLADEWAALRRSLDAPLDAPLDAHNQQTAALEQADERKSTDGDWSGRLSARRRSSQQQSSAALLAHFESSVLQIRDWVSVEEDMLRAQAVAVGDVDDIVHQLDKQKGVLRELEQKKPQLDELLHTAESLKGTENRQQLHGKGQCFLHP